MAEPATPVETSRPYHDLDISSGNFWNNDFATRDRTFRRLRAEPGLTWHQPYDSSPFPHDEKGFWAVTRLEDIQYISKHPELFSSAQGASIEYVPPGFEDVTGFILVMDPPRHTMYRRLVSAAFTPRNVAKLEQHIQQGAKEIVDDLIGAGEVDFVQACSKRLPMRTVSDLIGIAEPDREAVAKAADNLFGAADPEIRQGRDNAEFTLAQLEFLHAAAIDVATDRRKNPKDDLMTSIVQAEVDGHRLTDAEIGAFMVLLSTAGNDTTKQTTSHTIWALSRFPEQRAWLTGDFDGRIGSASEEFVRFASPVLGFARHAVTDTELRGTRITAGDKIGLFYCSGNRDESVFERPDELDLSRSPNPHVGFGGGGVHYCLGSAVAKLQLRSLFRELLFRVPDLEVGEPVWLESRIVHGVKRLPVTFR
jgi:cytochrome P450